MLYMKVKDIIAKPVKKKAKLRSPDNHTENPTQRFAAERKAVQRVKNSG